MNYKTIARVVRRAAIVAFLAAGSGTAFAGDMLDKAKEALALIKPESAIQGLTGALSGFGGIMLATGQTIFLTLATIELMVMAVEHVTTKGQDLERLIYALLRKGIVFSLMWSFMSPIWPGPVALGHDAEGDVTFPEFIAYSLTSLGAAAAHLPEEAATPSKLIATGLLSVPKIFMQVMSITSALDPTTLPWEDATNWDKIASAVKKQGASLYMLVLFVLPLAVLGGIHALLVAAILIVAAYQMLATMVEMTIGLGIGLFFLGGSASRWTTSFSDKAISYAVSVGVKMLVVFALVGAVLGGANLVGNNGAEPGTTKSGFDQIVAFTHTAITVLPSGQMPTLAEATAIQQGGGLAAMIFLLEMILLDCVMFALMRSGVEKIASAVSAGATSFTASGLGEAANRGVGDTAGAMHKMQSGAANVAGQGTALVQQGGAKAASLGSAALAFGSNMVASMSGKGGGGTTNSVQSTQGASDSKDGFAASNKQPAPAAVSDPKGGGVDQPAPGAKLADAGNKGSDDQSAPGAKPSPSADTGAKPGTTPSKDGEPPKTQDSGNSIGKYALKKPAGGGTDTPSGNNGGTNGAKKVADMATDSGGGGGAKEGGAAKDTPPPKLGFLAGVHANSKERAKNQRGDTSVAVGGGWVSMDSHLHKD